MTKALAYTVIAALLAGCTLCPAYERPAAELPAAWVDLPAQGAHAPAQRWWVIYGDPALDKLVDEALIQNQDLALAVARVDEARARARAVDSLQWPAIDATSANRGRDREPGLSL